jgi:spore coat polysaccharide biosynthesis predicted glycosyltransferase SpsG
MNVLIHADGGPGVGLGHVARCFALAAAVSRTDHRAVVAVDPAHGLAECIQRQGLEVIPSGSGALAVRDAARAIAADCLVVDSYQWSGDDFRLARGEWSLVAFDDQAVRELPVDVVINGAPGAAKLKYRTASDTHLLLGPAYQVVRDDFRATPARGKAGKVRQVIALVGGYDSLGLLPTLADILQEAAERLVTPFKSELICGPFMALPDLHGMSYVEAVRNPPDLAKRMIRADMAISASGQTLYELARCGTPTIAFCSGPDQVHNLFALAASGVVMSTGDATELEWSREIRAAIAFLLGNSAKRTAMSQAGQSLIDGLGADRLVEVITLLGTSGLSPEMRGGIRN